MSTTNDVAGTNDNAVADEAKILKRKYYELLETSYSLSEELHSAKKRIKSLTKENKFLLDKLIDAETAQEAAEPTTRTSTRQRKKRTSTPAKKKPPVKRAASARQKSKRTQAAAQAAAAAQQAQQANIVMTPNAHTPVISLATPTPVIQVPTSVQANPVVPQQNVFSQHGPL